MAITCSLCGKRKGFLITFYDIEGMPVCYNCTTKDSSNNLSEEDRHKIYIEKKKNSSSQVIKSTPAEKTPAVYPIIQVIPIPLRQVKKNFIYNYNSEILKTYKSFKLLKNDILCGNLKRNFAARVVRGKGDIKKANWSSIEKISKGIDELKFLYNPVWSHSTDGFIYGAVIGVILKAIDTTWLFFTLDQKLGILWLIIIGALILSRWITWAGFIPIIFFFNFGLKVNLFASFLSVMFIGIVFGGPIGIIIGTIVGLVRSYKLDKAPDAHSEGKSIYVLGIFTPLLFLIVASIGYFYWLTPLSIKWLSNF